MNPTNILKLCLDECNGDPIAALQAADHILSISSRNELCTDQNYPRNNSNQFVRKHLIVEAARDQEYYLTLRQSIPDTEQPKLDELVAHLQSGGTIHHPRETPELAVNSDGDMPNATSMIYQELVALRKECQERLDTLTKTVTEIQSTLSKSAALALDQQGHEHRGKGDPRGGQFAPKGQGNDKNPSKNNNDTQEDTTDDPRNKLIERALTNHPSLAPYGDKLSISNTHDKQIHQHIMDLSLVPEKLANKVSKRIKGIFIGAGGVPELDDMSELRGVPPRGWSEGSTWDTVGGAYDPAKKSIVVGGGPNILSASKSAILHEYGHAVDDIMLVSINDEFMDIHQELYDSLTPYLQQDGPAGQAGCEELFAEGFAHTIKDEQEARKIYGDRLVDFIIKNVLS